MPTLRLCLVNGLILRSPSTTLCICDCSSLKPIPPATLVPYLLCHRLYSNSPAHLPSHSTPDLSLLLRYSLTSFTHCPVLAAMAGHSPRLYGALTLQTPSAIVFVNGISPPCSPSQLSNPMGFSMLAVWHSFSTEGLPPLLPSSAHASLLAKLLCFMDNAHMSLPVVIPELPVDLHLASTLPTPARAHSPCDTISP